MEGNDFKDISPTPLIISKWAHVCWFGAERGHQGDLREWRWMFSWLLSTPGNTEVPWQEGRRRGGGHRLRNGKVNRVWGACTHLLGSSAIAYNARGWVDGSDVSDMWSVVHEAEERG